MQNVLKVDDDKRFNRLAIAGLILGFLLQMTVVVTAFLTYSRNQDSSARVEHTHAVLREINQFQVLIERTETAVRGYLLRPDAARVATFHENADAIPPTLDQIDKLTRDNPNQVNNLARLRQVTDQELLIVNATMTRATSGDLADATGAFVDDLKVRRVLKVRKFVDAMVQEEDRLLAARRDNELRSALILKVVLGGAAFLMLLVALFTILLARRYIDHLSAARNRLEVLNTDLEGEVGRRTADLLRANEEVQRFAYIVSHDLRSPLVNILGFTAELENTNKTLGGLIEHAEHEAPALLTPEVRDAQTDLPEAIGFIRASTQKMDRLINAILKLSREGRRTLTPELLPMDHVVDEIVASMVQRIESAGATLTIEKPLPNITNDRVAIEQIFSNIIENAVKYLDSARAGDIRIRGRVEGARAIFEFQDNGRGIDPKDHQRIFELFRRSGAQDRAGEGIGLAQVRNLVNRLGGYIDVESELGQGALFRLNLPSTYEDHGAGNE